MNITQIVHKDGKDKTLTAKLRKRESEILSDN